MLTEEQLREIEAEQHHAAMGRWVTQLLTMVRELQRERDHFRNQIRDYAIQERGMSPAHVDELLDLGAKEASDD